MRKFILLAAMAGIFASLAGATGAQAKKRHAAPATQQDSHRSQATKPGGGSNSK
jgi:hypothetical protein